MSDTAGRREELALVRAHLEAEAFAYAARVRSLVSLAEAYGSVEDRDLLLGLAGAGRMGQVRAFGVLERARRLHDCFPDALVLLEHGRLFVHTVETMLRATKGCSDAVLSRLGRLPAALAGLDAADVHVLLERTIAEATAEVEAAEAQERHARARANRGVWVIDVENGMSRVGAEVDALSARRFALDLDVLVRAEKTRDARDGVSRTMAQRRADVLMSLPARYLALVQSIVAGKAEGLLAEAVARSSSGHTPSGAGAAQPELELGLPAQCRAAEHALDPEELLVELLRQPLGSRTVLNVHVPMSSALGLDQAPALVEGGGYLPAWLARLMLPDTALRRVVVDGATGIPVYLDLDPVTSHLRLPGPDAPPGPGRTSPPRGPSGSTGPGKPRRDRRSRPDTTDDPVVGASLPAEAEREIAEHERAREPQRRALIALLGMLTPVLVPDTTETGRFPSARLRRLVETRDQRCTGPGCRRPARLCDLDHELEHHLGGPTAESNLSAKSPRCHHARHDGWTVTRDQRTGVSTWTSPTGETYTRRPAWVRHQQHNCVVSISPKPLSLPDVETDYPADRPLWRPTYRTETAPSVSAVTPAVPKMTTDPWAGWGSEPPPF